MDSTRLNCLNSNKTKKTTKRLKKNEQVYALEIITLFYIKIYSHYAELCSLIQVYADGATRSGPRKIKKQADVSGEKRIKRSRKTTEFVELSSKNDDHECYRYKQVFG